MDPILSSELQLLSPPATPSSLVLSSLLSASLPDVYSKLTSLKQNLHIQLNSLLDTNYDELIENSKTEKINIKELNEARENLKLKKSRIGNFLNKFDNLKGLIPTLQNANEAKKIIWQAQQFLKCANLIKSMKDVIDLKKAISLIKEVEGYQELQGIGFYDNEIENINKFKASTLERIEKRLNTGLASKSFEEISYMVEILDILGTLQSTVLKIANENLKQWQGLIKNLFIKEYDSSILLVFGNEIKHVFNEGGEFGSHMLLLAKAIRNRRFCCNLRDEICTKCKPYESLDNIFSNFWLKQQDIFTKSCMRLQADSKLATNYHALLRCYPKIFNFFNELVLNLQQFSLKISPTQNIDLPLPTDILRTLSEGYFDVFNNELMIRISKTIEFLNAKRQSIEIWADFQKLLNFIAFELKETHKIPPLSKKISTILISTFQSTLKNILENCSNDDYIQILSTTTFWYLELINNIFLEKNEYEQMDNLIFYYEEFNHEIIKKNSDKIFNLLFKTLNTLYEMGKINKNIGGNQVWEILNNILQVNNTRLNGLLENNSGFANFFEKMIDTFINLYFMLQINFNDYLSKDLDYFKLLVEKLRLNINLTIKLSQIEKLTSIEVSNTLQEYHQNAFSLIPISLLIAYVIKKSDKMKKRENSLVEYLKVYFEFKDEKFNSMSLTFESEGTYQTVQKEIEKNKSLENYLIVEKLFEGWNINAKK